MKAFYTNTKLINSALSWVALKFFSDAVDESKKQEDQWNKPITMICINKRPHKVFWFNKMQICILHFAV